MDCKHQVGNSSSEPEQSSQVAALVHFFVPKREGGKRLEKKTNKSEVQLYFVAHTSLAAKAVLFC